jgi:murein DD-endopeptidase MepM/ murein hydrolase activator NlpD
MDSNVIANQHVTRRRKPSLPHTVNTEGNHGVFHHSAAPHRADTFRSGFVQQIQQRPVHARHSHGTDIGARHTPPLFSGFKKKPRPAAPADVREQPARDERRNPRQGNTAPRSAGFSFSIPSLATLAVVAGIVLLALLALNWEGIDLTGPISKSFDFEPAPDPAETERQLAEYVGIPLSDAVFSGAGSAPAPSPTMPIIEEIPGEEIPLDMIETYSWTSYQVQKGDSVSKIAANFSVSMDAIIASNDIRNARRLREGETLRIPNMDGIPYTVKKGDSLTKISKSLGVPLRAILDANDLDSAIIQPGETLFVPGAKMAPEALKLALGELMMYPIRGRLTSGFGWRNDPLSGDRRYHAAIDLAAGIGVPVKAAMDGTISVTGNNPTYGKFVIISHDGGYQTMYAHLSTISLKQGDSVKQGGKIGEVGSTGYSTGPHLHFAVYKNGRAVNPFDVLN